MSTPTDKDSHQFRGSIGGSADGHCSVSDTPRTNDATLTEPYLVRELSFEVVTTDFSRELERELNASTSENNRLLDVIKRARTEFFRDGADAMAAVNMLSALNDV